VFASLPSGDRDAAKCYMQQRIERLHAAQGTWNTPWFSPPQGASNLPADKISIDSNLLLTPPTGMEHGYVPIPTYNRLRVKPSECEVTLGSLTTEPNPLPSNHYNDEQKIDESLDQEVCVGNSETSNQPFDYPGTIYPFSPTSSQANRPSYNVPLRANVGSVLPTVSATCGLGSDPPTGTAASDKLCGSSPTKLACTGGADGQFCDNGGIPNGYFTGGDTSTCSCLCYGYIGNNCETAVSSSACTNGANGSPCQNGGSASGTSGSCGCTCVGGYTGNNCETAASSSSTCTNGENGSPCQNGGSASGTSGSCGCTCVGGYTGKNCETAASSSSTCTNGENGSPCQNGGSASGTSGSCGCTCVGGYTGKNCETSQIVHSPSSSPGCDQFTGPEATTCPVARCSAPAKGCSFVTRYSADSSGTCCPILCKTECTADDSDDSDPAPAPIEDQSNTSAANNDRWQRFVVVGTVLLTSFLLVSQEQ